MKKVALVNCNTYEQEMVEKAVNEAVNLLGGFKQFVKSGQTVVLKPNLVSKINPDKVATTHPSIVEAVAKEVVKLGARCIIADSPGGPYTKAYLNSVYKGTKMSEAATNSGAKLNNDFTHSVVDFGKGAVIGKKVEIINVLENADVIINLCKMKTHAFTGYTGAVKNMFGAIPGLVKVQMHARFKTLDPFCNFNIDTIEYFGTKLNLHICDAVIGMEGAGPTAGKPKPVRKIMASSDSYALDTVMVKLMNANPNDMVTLRLAKERGLLDENYNVEVLGENLEDSVIKDYDTIIAKDLMTLENKGVYKLINNFITRRPVIKVKGCIGCKKCKIHCPVEAIEMVETRKRKNKVAKINYDKCIKCFCCQELCPEHTIKVKTPLGYRLIKRIDLKKQRKNNKKVKKQIVNKK